MAKLLFKQGNFKILADNLAKLSAAETNKLIQIAGTTCYQARETTKKTPEEFIKMLYTRGHLSVLEHSWFCYGIYPEKRDNIARIGYKLYKANNLFSITEAKEGYLIVSGNSRMFYEAFDKYRKQPDYLLTKIFADLNRKNPELFSSPIFYDISIAILYGNEIPVDFFGKISDNPAIKTAEERLAHTAMCVEFNNHCRGFTHEHVRHRLASFSQESTRYVDYAKGDVNLDEFQMQFILPYNDKFDFSKKIEFICDGKAHIMSPVEFTNMIEAFYRALRKAGLKSEEARQWLPIGLKSQIVTTANLKEWRHWFYMRARESAHSEIKWTALNFLRICKVRWPDLFDDFEFTKSKKDGSECAIFTGVMTP